jgi:uncharacterized protein with von Willebrand factor type A (vWA) domain
VRPAGELGPIIVCLDTSGSMYGAREVVAKALVLECMRGAQMQARKCYVYAFSGPGQVRALDLSEPQVALEKLLDFLECSFQGGTDVDQPLELALERLNGACAASLKLRWHRLKNKTSCILPLHVTCVEWSLCHAL